MTLTDAGPLVALIDAGESDHERCVEALNDLALPLVTTWPAFTEAMYLLGAAGGQRAQQALWRMLGGGGLELAELDASEVERSARLMQKYADRPMDLADATLVACAESRKLTKVFTLDSDFHVYRLNGGRPFEIVPDRCD
ncbi:MAG: PIN domain-containing protein [Actinobacteria bacterium]|nr:PIN domain-containing protein [Actinomycetota bacterium]